MGDFWYEFSKNKMAVFGLLVISLYIVLAVLAPIVAPADPYQMDSGNRLQPPGESGLMGTDHFGRDIFSRIIYGVRISFQVGIISVSIALAAGVSLGVLAGYFGGFSDSLVSRVIEVLFSFPDIILALAVMAVLGPSLTNLMIAIGIVYTPIFARITRGAVLEIKNSLFIEAARSIGVNNFMIMARHILPNVLAPIIIQTTLSLAFAILSEAALSFLGFGVSPDTPSWGIMLKDGKGWMERAWWVAVFPGLAITLAVLSFNLLGDGLRDALDPKMSSELS
ncbi:MAG: ABC transporter permease [Bacillota bacterium]